MAIHKAKNESLSVINDSALLQASNAGTSMVRAAGGSSLAANKKSSIRIPKFLKMTGKKQNVHERNASRRWTM